MQPEPCLSEDNPQVHLRKGSILLSISGSKYLGTLHKDEIIEDVGMPDLFYGLGLLDNRPVFCIFLHRIFASIKSPGPASRQHNFWAVLELKKPFGNYQIGFDADFISEKEALLQAIWKDTDISQQIGAQSSGILRQIDLLSQSGSSRHHSGLL